MIEFQAADILFFIGYSIGLSQYVLKSRRPMVLTRTLSSCIMIVYMSLIGAHVAAVAAAIAAFGGLMQAAFPDNVLQKTLVLRLSIAIGMSVLAAFTCVRSPADILPLLATANGRLAEVQSCPQRIRIMLVLSQLAWITYHFQQGYTLLLCAELLAITINTTCIWRFEQARRRAQPLDAAA